MPILYKNNPMPLSGALFVTNPARRQNQDRFRKWAAQQKGIKGKYSAAKLKQLAKKEPAKYKKITAPVRKRYASTKETRRAQHLIKNAVNLKMVWAGTKSASAKAAAKKHAVAMMKKELGFTAKTANSMWTKYYKAPKSVSSKSSKAVKRKKAAPKRRKASTRKRATSRKKAATRKPRKRTTAKAKRAVKGKNIFKAANGRFYKKLASGQVRFISNAEAKKMGKPTRRKSSGKKRSSRRRRNPLGAIRLNPYSGYRVRKNSPVTMTQQQWDDLRRLQDISDEQTARGWTAAKKRAMDDEMSAQAVEKGKKSAALKAKMAKYPLGGTVAIAQEKAAAGKKQAPMTDADYATALEIFGASHDKAMGSAAKAAVKRKRIVPLTTLSGKCKDLRGAWNAYRAYQKANGKKISSYAYVYTWIPMVAKACVTLGQLSQEEADDYIKRKKAAYRKKSPAKKRKATKAKRKTTKKTTTRKRRTSKLKLTDAAGRAIVPASIDKKVKAGRMLKWGEFRTAFRGCGHTAKQLGRMYKAYKREFEKGKRPTRVGSAGIGAVKRKRRKTTSKRKTKKRSTRKGGRRKTARRAYEPKKGRTLPRKGLWSYILKRSKMMRKDKKPLHKAGRARLKRDYQKMAKHAEGLYKKGKGKAASVDAAIRKYRKDWGRKGYKYNPRRRRNAAAVPVLNQWLGFVDSFSNSLKSSTIPLVPMLAPAIKPVAIGVPTAYGMYYAGKWIGPQIAKLPVLGEYAAKGVYTGIGATLWIGMGILAKFNLIEMKSANVFGGAATMGGLIIDIVDHLRGEPAAPALPVFEEEVVVTEQPAADLNAIHLNNPRRRQARSMGAIQLNNPRHMGAIHLNGLHGNEGQALHGYGDGMAYAMGTPASIHLGYILSQYSDAKAGDAQYCPSDLSTKEGKAAVKGAKSWLDSFEPATQRRIKIESPHSAHAGKEGHCWGWLIKMIGFDNFQKIAMLPPKKRLQVINELKSKALSSMQKTLQSMNHTQAIESASLHVDGAINGAGGVNGVGYGSLIFAGSGY